MQVNEKEDQTITFAKITIYPAASGSKRTRFNAGINSGESELQVASLARQRRQMKLFVSGNLYK